MTLLMERSVSAIVLYDPEGRMLLQHRTDDAETMPGYWAFFGGGIKSGELPEQTVMREAFEELAYRLSNPELTVEREIVVDGKDYYIYVYTEEFRGDKSCLRLQEGQDWGWFTIDDTRSLKMLDQDRDIISEVASYIRKGGLQGTHS
jgi:8-oxo-dGTP pyrophosphatase MutT (NUDIX family)